MESGQYVTMNSAECMCEMGYPTKNKRSWIGNTSFCRLRLGIGTARQSRKNKATDVNGIKLQTALDNWA
jgi:hypothetical protein